MKSFILSLLASVLCLLPARAANQTWDGGTGNWNVPTNWSGDVLPPSDGYSTYINNGAVLLPVGVSGTYSWLELRPSSGKSSSINISGGILWGYSADIGSGGGSASVTISSGTWINQGAISLRQGSLQVNGGLVSNEDGRIGGQGIVTVAGGTWANSRDLMVGNDYDSSTGSLTVSGAGRVTAQTLYASLSDLHGNGTISAKGAVLDSALVFDSTHGLQQTLSFGSGGQLSLDVNGSGALGAGYRGTGSLTIADGVGVTSYYGYLGYGSSSNGSATVTGPGSAWNTSYLYVGSGTGSLLIANGGLVSSAYSSYIGNGGNGAVTVTSGTFANARELYVGGYSGTGSLTVSGDGRVTAQTIFTSLADLHGSGTISAQGAVLDGNLVFDSTHGLQQALAFGSGGQLLLNISGSGGLGAGYRGAGSLRIADGVSVTSSYGYLGYNSNSNGSATVTGPGSTWNAGGLYVGNGFSRTGSLLITNGGRVISSYSTINNGSATVSSGTWTVSSLTVGAWDDGSLSVTNGGLVSSSGVKIGEAGHGSVIVSGGTLTTSYLDLGDYWDSGSLLVNNGGRVSSSQSTVRVGSVTVTGAGSSWVNTGSVTVGFDRDYPASIAVTDHGLVKVGDTSGETIFFSTAGGSSNFLRLDDGYIALFGDQTSYVGSLITGGHIQLWNGSAWTTSTSLAGFNFSFYSDEADALAFSGYAGLGGYTILTNYVPPPDPAEEHIWKGTTGSWNTATNWSTDTVPTSNDDVIVDNGGTVLAPADVAGSYSELRIGASPGGSGSIAISGGMVSGGYGFLGYAAGSSGTATISSGAWQNSDRLYVGHAGTGSLQINGGRVSNASGQIGYLEGSVGSVTVTSGTWSNAFELRVGNEGTGDLLIEGGVVTSRNGYIGYSATGQGSVTVTGENSTWINTGNLAVGVAGSNNTLTITDKGLVKVGDTTGETIAFSTNGGTNNFLRLDGGYLALYGDQTAYVGSLISAGHIQLWDGASWITSTNTADFNFSFYSDASIAQAFSGRSGLGGYTILTNGSSTPDPDPGPGGSGMITFNEFTPGEDLGTSVVIDGMVFSSDYGISIVSTGTAGTPALGGFYIEMTAEDGGPFSLISMDFISLSSPDIDLTVQFWLAEGGSVATSFDNLADGTTLSQLFGMENILRAEFYADGDFAIDNISLAVPEPGTAALVGVGLASLLLRRRRREA